MEEGKMLPGVKAGRSKKVLIWFLLFLFFMWICTLISKAVYAHSLPMVSVVSPQAKYVEHRVEADGIVVAGGEKPVTYRQGLRIEEISVRVGEQVEEGDPLFQIDLGDLRELMDKKQDEIDQLSLQINTILENQALEQQKKELELQRAREDYDTISRLQNTKVGRAEESYVQAEEEMEGNSGDKELEGALQSAAYGEADAKAQRDEAIRDAGRKVEDAALPDASSSELETAQIQKQALLEELSEYQEILDAGGAVKAPCGGVVTDIAISPGGRIPDTAVLLLSDDSVPCQLKVNLNKDQKKYVDLGDPVSVEIAGGTKLDKSIEYLAESRLSAETYEALIELPEGTGIPGASGSISCSDPGEKFSLCIPPSLIYSENNRYFVYVMKTREGILGEEYYIEEVTVKILDQNEDWAAVEGALDQDSKIVSSATKEIKKGDVVRCDELS